MKIANILFKRYRAPRPGQANSADGGDVGVTLTATVYIEVTGVSIRNRRLNGEHVEVLWDYVPGDPQRSGLHPASTTTFPPLRQSIEVIYKDEDGKKSLSTILPVESKSVITLRTRAETLGSATLDVLSAAQELLQKPNHKEDQLTIDLKNRTTLRCTAYLRLADENGRAYGRPSQPRRSRSLGSIRLMRRRSFGERTSVPGRTSVEDFGMSTNKVDEKRTATRTPARNGTDKMHTDSPSRLLPSKLENVLIEPRRQDPVLFNDSLQMSSESAGSSLDHPGTSKTQKPAAQYIDPKYRRKIVILGSSPGQDGVNPPKLRTVQISGTPMPVPLGSMPARAEENNAPDYTGPFDESSVAGPVRRQTTANPHNNNNKAMNHSKIRPPQPNTAQRHQPTTRASRHVIGKPDAGESSEPSDGRTNGHPDLPQVDRGLRRHSIATHHTPTTSNTSIPSTAERASAQAEQSSEVAPPKSTEQQPRFTPRSPNNSARSQLHSQLHSLPHELTGLGNAQSPNIFSMSDADVSWSQQHGVNLDMVSSAGKTKDDLPSVQDTLSSTVRHEKRGLSKVQSENEGLQDQINAIKSRYTFLEHMPSDETAALEIPATKEDWNRRIDQLEAGLLQSISKMEEFKEAAVQSGGQNSLHPHLQTQKETQSTESHPDATQTTIALKAAIQQEQKKNQLLKRLDKQLTNKIVHLQSARNTRNNAREYARVLAEEECKRLTDELRTLDRK